MSDDLIIGEIGPKGKVVELVENDKTKWIMGIAMCEICRNVWLSQKPIEFDSKALQCPRCERFRSYFIPQMMIKQLFDVEAT